MAAIVLMLAMLLFPSLSMADWDVSSSSPETKWATNTVVKWQTDGSVFEESKADAPDEGWYRYGTDYTTPEGWPGWAKERFVSLSSGMTEEDKRFSETWVAPGLKTDTLWMDAKASKLNGSIQVSIPNFQFFTYVMIDPPTGIVD